MVDSHMSVVIFISGFAIDRHNSCSVTKARTIAPAVFAVCVVVILLVFNIALKVVVDVLRVDAMILSQIPQYRLFETWRNNILFPQYHLPQ